MTDADAAPLTIQDLIDASKKLSESGMSEDDYHRLGVAYARRRLPQWEKLQQTLLRSLDEIASREPDLSNQRFVGLREQLELLERGTTEKEPEGGWKEV
jgi:hypothetical protein